MCHCWRGRGKEASSSLKMDESDGHCHPALGRGDPPPPGSTSPHWLPGSCLLQPPRCSLWSVAQAGLSALSKAVLQAPFLSHTLSLGHLIQPQSFKYPLYTSDSYIDGGKKMGERGFRCCWLFMGDIFFSPVILLHFLFGKEVSCITGEVQVEAGVG